MLASTLAPLTAAASLILPPATPADTPALVRPETLVAVQAAQIESLERRASVRERRLERRIRKLHRRALRAERKARHERRRTRAARRALRLPVVVRLGLELRRQGYLVAEHPLLGGVAPVHATHSYHYPPCSCAIDVNWPNPSTEPRHLDALYRRLRAWSHARELLWRVPDHYDHLHVAAV